MLRVAREGLNLSQECLAESLHVDVNTVKAWETGRRPLGNVKAASLNGIVRRLHVLGADSRTLGKLPTAIDVDATVSSILNSPPTGPPAEHPLATWVINRSWTRLLTETMNESSRLVSSEEHKRFCDGLCRAAESTLTTPDDEQSLLLRRQVLYVLASISSHYADWLAEMSETTSQALRDATNWSPAWVACRSIAIARTTTGDADSLHWFMREYLHSDSLEAANFNYWAYWVGGEGDTPEALSDQFMANRLQLSSWHGRALIRHLIATLEATSPHVELTAHSLWALVDQRPHLLEPDLAVRLTRQSRQILDNTSSAALAVTARREIEQLHYAARLATTKGER